MNPRCVPNAVRLALELDEQWRIQVWADRAAIDQNHELLVAAPRSLPLGHGGQLSFNSLSLDPSFA